MVLSSSDWAIKNKEFQMGEEQLPDANQNMNIASTLDEILKIHAEMKKMNWFEGEDPFQVILETISVQRERLIKAAIWAYDLKLLADEAIGGNMLSDVEQELADWLKSEKSSWEKESEIASGNPDWNNAQTSHIKSEKNRRASVATRSLWAWYGKNFPERIPSKFITTKEWTRAHKAWLAETNIEHIKKGLNFKISFHDRKLNGIRDFITKENAGFFKSINVDSALKLLTNVCSIGPETARTIALFYFNLPFIIFDEYLLRISRQHRWIPKNSNKWNAENKRLLENYIFSWLAEGDEKKKIERLKAFHAIIDDWGNKYCHEKKPNCEECDLRSTLKGKKTSYFVEIDDAKESAAVHSADNKCSEMNTDNLIAAVSASRKEVKHLNAEGEMMHRGDIRTKLERLGYEARQNKPGAPYFVNLSGPRSAVDKEDFIGLILLNPRKNLIFGACPEIVREFREKVMEQRGGEWKKLEDVPGRPGKDNYVTVKFNETCSGVVCEIKNGQQPIEIKGITGKLNFQDDNNFCSWEDVQKFLNQKLSPYCPE